MWIQLSCHNLSCLFTILPKPLLNLMENKVKIPNLPPELQLNKANVSDNEAPFLDLHLSTSYVSSHPKFMINAMTLILIQ